MAKQCDYVTVPSSWTLSDTFNALQAIFIKYREWEDALNEAVMTGASFDRLIELSLPVFNNTMLVHDSDFNIVAFASPPNAQFPNDFYSLLNESGTFPSNFLEEFMRQDSFLASFKEKQPGYWFDEAFKTVSSYINIPLTDDYIVRISIDSTNVPLYSGDLIKLKMLARAIRLFYSSPATQGHQPLLRLDVLLQDLVESTRVEEEALGKQMHLYGWSYEDQYLCLKVQSSIPSVDGYQLKSISERLQNLHAGSCAFPYEDHVVLVQNLSHANLTEAEFLEVFGRSLEENGLRAGASYSFGDLFSLDKMQVQADIALHYGQFEGEARLCTFERATLRYLVDNSERRLAVEYLCPKPLLLLVHYDKFHKTELVSTLQTFLENKCSVSRCCEKLFVHRSTLLYRIERVQDITGIDLEDADTRLLYQLSLRMLGRRLGGLGAVREGVQHIPHQRGLIAQNVIGTAATVCSARRAGSPARRTGPRTARQGRPDSRRPGRTR